jgi:hypothetical protein
MTRRKREGVVIGVVDVHRNEMVMCGLAAKSMVSGKISARKT